MRNTFSHIFCISFLSLMLCSFSLTAQNSLDKNDPVITAREYLNHHKNELLEDNLSLVTTLNFLTYTVKNNLFNFYPEAEQAYFTTLEKIIPSLYVSELQYELDHTMLLADEETRERFELLLKSDYSLFAKELKLFWNKLNPNPEYDYNIRFFEHWGRLIYAKNNFTFRNNSIIKTDDRGPVHVMYGEPAKKVAGVLPYSSQRVRGYMREFDVLNTGWSTNQELNNAFLSNLVSQYYSPPRYEVWIYKEISSSSIIYLFGNNGDTSQFGLRRSLEEMIPTNSFRARDELRRFNTGPSLFLQLMMYDYFSMYDPFFNDAFKELESQLLSTVNVSSPEFSRAKMQQHGNELARSQYLAPQQHSNYISNLYKLDIDYEVYLSFDENGLPVNFSFLSVELPESFKESKLYPIRFSVFDYDSFLNSSVYDTLLHTIPDQETFLMSFQSPVMTLGTVNSYSEGHFLKDFYDAMHISHNILESTNEHADNNSEWVSDLIIGSRNSEDQFNYNNSLVPFNITPSGIYNDNDILTFYLAVKNPAKKEGFHTYQMDIEIEKKNRRFLFFKRSNKTNFVYTLAAETRNLIDEQVIEIETSDLSSGNYSLNVTVTSSSNSQSVVRTSQFKIK